jgi:hypothetical protein
VEELRIYSPEGGIGRPTRSLAASPEVLSGQRLAILDNGKPNAVVVMQRLAEKLVERAGVEFVGVFAKGSAATPCEPELLAEIQSRADLVLTGSAD